MVVWKILVGYLNFCLVLNAVLYQYSDLLWSACSQINAYSDQGGNDAEIFFLEEQQKIPPQTQHVEKNNQQSCSKAAVSLSAKGCSLWVTEGWSSAVSVSLWGYYTGNSCIFHLFLSSIMLPSLFSVCFFPPSPLPKLLSMCYGNAALLSTHEVPAFIGGWYE